MCRAVSLDMSHFKQIKFLQETYINLIYGQLLSEFIDNLTAGNFIGCFDEDRLIGYSGSVFNFDLMAYTTLMTDVDKEY